MNEEELIRAIDLILCALVDDHGLESDEERPRDWDEQKNPVVYREYAERIVAEVKKWLGH